VHLHLGRAENVDPLEQGLGQELAAGRLGLVPQARQVPHGFDRFLWTRTTRASFPGPSLILIESPHGGLKCIRVAVAAVAGHGCIAVAIDAGESDRIGSGLVSGQPIQHGAGKLGVGTDMAESLADQRLERIGRVAHALMAAVFRIAEGARRSLARR
jgi:hypothetical protein